MMGRLCIWDTETPFSDAFISKLSAKSTNILRLSHLDCYPDGYQIPAYSEEKLTLYPNFIPTTPTPLELADVIKEFVPIFIKCESRHQRDRYDVKNAVGLNVIEIQDLCFRLSHYFFEIFSSNNITGIVFSSPPVNGVDTAAYLMSKHLNIPIIVLEQCLESTHSTNVSPLSTVAISKGSFNINISSLVDAIESELVQAKQSLTQLKRHNLSRFISRQFFKIAKSVINKDGTPYATDVHHLGLSSANEKIVQYVSSYSKHARSSWKNKTLYVYVPLARESIVFKESALECESQLSAIENLRELIPSTVSLVIHDYPDVLKSRRTPDFFRRLSQLDNCILAPLLTPISDLINGSIAVATSRCDVQALALASHTPLIQFNSNMFSDQPSTYSLDSIESWLDEIFSEQSIKHTLAVKGEQPWKEKVTASGMLISDDNADDVLTLIGKTEAQQ
jgi:hypothetical protein